MSFNKKFKSNIGLIIFILALIVRITYVSYQYHNGITSRLVDSKAYYKLAEQIIVQGPFYKDLDKIQPATMHTVGPGISWFMALGMLLFGKHWFAFFIINSFIGALICVLIYKLGKELIDYKVGILAGFWSILYQPFLSMLPGAGKDNLIVFFFTLILLILCKYTSILQNKHKLLYTLLLGIVFSLLLLVDERYFVYLPILILGMLFLEREVWKKNIKYVIVFLIVVIISLTPWTIRNYKVFNRFILLTVRTQNFTNPIFGYKPIEKYNVNMEDWWYISPAQIDLVISGHKVRRSASDPFLQGYTKKTAPYFSDKQAEAMKKGILPRKFSTTERYLVRLNMLWMTLNLKDRYIQDGYRFNPKSSLRHNIIIFFNLVILFPFILLGLYKVYKMNFIKGLFVSSIILLHTVIHVLFVPFINSRYRHPIDLILIIFGCYGIITVYQYLKYKEQAN